MLRRSFRIVAQFLGLLALGALAAVAFLAWRLSAGPVSFAYLTPYFEEALSPEDGRYLVRIDDTILDWEQAQRALNVKLLGARVLSSDQTLILRAPELYVSLSGSALLHGEIAPRSISISQASLKIARTEAGEFVLGTESDALSTGGSSDRNWTLSDLLTGDTGRAARYLTRVNILNADVAIEDRLLDVSWTAPAVNISLLRMPNGINATTDLDLTVGGQTASVQLNADYKQPSGELTVSLGFNDLRPSALANVSTSLAALEGFDIPMGGAVTIDLDRQGNIVKAGFNLAGQAGRIAMQSPIALDVPVRSSRFRGTYAAADDTLRVDEANLGFADDADIVLPTPVDQALPLREIAVHGSWSIQDNQIVVPAFTVTMDRPVINGTLAARASTDGLDVDATVKGSGFAFDDIMRYWPKTIGVNPRNWIEKHMPSGRIDDVHAEFSAVVRDGMDVDVTSLGGEITARDLVVDYLPPMPKITKGIALAKFDQKRFTIDVPGGEAAGLTAKGRVIIDNLDEKDQWTDIDVRITGPLAGVLRVIDSQPLNYARAVGLSPTDAKGDTSTRLKLRFIAENRLTVDEIKMSAEAEAKGASLPSVAFGLPLADGNLKLVLDNAGMDVTGTATLGGLPSELTWRENFGKKAPFNARYRVKASADANVWRDKAGLDFAMIGPDVLAGRVAGDINATMMSGGRGTVALEMGLDDASLTVEPLGFTKAAGDPAHASIQLTLNQNKVSELPKIVLSGKDLDIDASMTFGGDGKMTNARLTRVHAGETDLYGSVAAQPEGWKVDLNGKALDLKAVMEDKTPEDPNKKRGDSYAVSVNVDKLRLYEDRYLEKVRGTASYDGLVVREAHFTGVPPAGGALRIDLTPQGNERKMAMVSDNAGGVMRAFDLSDNVVGGNLDINGTYAGMTPGVCFGGRAAVDNFRVRNAPVLARLLNVATVVGLVDVLRGEGIGFDTLRANFTKKDGITRFENAKASGLSIGLTASGWTNSREETVEIEGEVIPANILNGLLGKIPLVGGIFGGDSGVFAINYKIAGKEKDPDVSANPLAAITPGFTRKIFNIFDKPDEEAPAGCPKSS